MDRSNIIPSLARQGLGWSQAGVSPGTDQMISDLEAGRGSPHIIARWNAAKCGVRAALKFMGDALLDQGPHKLEIVLKESECSPGGNPKEIDDYPLPRGLGHRATKITIIMNDGREVVVKDRFVSSHIG